MKSRLFQAIAFCIVLLGLSNCSTEPSVPKKEPAPVKYNINLDGEDLSSFMLTLMKQSFSVEFNPYLCGDENSIAYFQINDWQADNDFMKILIDFYKEHSEEISYAMQIQIVKPDFEIRINKRFINNEEGEKMPLQSWHVSGLLYNKSLEVFDDNGDGKLESIVYKDRQIGPFSKENVTFYYPKQIPSEKLKDIISQGFKLYYDCRKYVDNLELNL